MSKAENISKWYESVIYNSGIASPGLVKGTIFIHSRGWYIWEKIKNFVDQEFLKHGIRNVSFPTLIPVSEIEKEKSKLTGFIPELFLVSKSKDSEDSKSVFLRPTSEILFSHFFRKNLNSYEDLPFLFNQWCNVFRAEKNTKAFLRNCEFHWQEAHTLHETKEEAMEYLNIFNNVYKSLVRDILRIDFLEGEKTVNERFRGADKTLTLEAIMPDAQSLQIATSHYLSQNFSEIFDVKYTDKNNSKQYPYQLSAGCSTRLLGALILSHSDDKGLVLPLSLAEYHIKVLVIDGVVDKDSELVSQIKEALKDYSVGWDFGSKSFGYKMKNEEMSGTPFVLVIGKKEIEANQFMLKSRLNSEKLFCTLSDLSSFFKREMQNYDEELFRRSKENLSKSIVSATTFEEVKKAVLQDQKIVLAPWFDDEENEVNFKNEQLGFGTRCIKNRIDNPDVKCFYSGKKANAYVYFGRSY